MALLLALAGAAPARAADGEAKLWGAVQAGAALGEPTAAIGELEGGVLLGLDDFLWLGGSVSTGLAPDGGAQLTPWIGGQWALDVLQWVPWLEVAAGARIGGDVRPIGRVGLGVERVIGFDGAVGIFARAQFAPGADEGPSVLGGLRLTWRWEL